MNAIARCVWSKFCCHFRAHNTGRKSISILWRNLPTAPYAGITADLLAEAQVPSLASEMNPRTSLCGGPSRISRVSNQKVYHRRWTASFDRPNIVGRNGELGMWRKSISPCRDKNIWKSQRIVYIYIYIYIYNQRKTKCLWMTALSTWMPVQWRHPVCSQVWRRRDAGRLNAQASTAEDNMSRDVINRQTILCRILVIVWQSGARCYPVVFTESMYILSNNFWERKIRTIMQTP